MIPAIGHDGFVGLTIGDTVLAEEKIDPKLVAWGKPDGDGLSLGAYLSPKKDKYEIGERVRLRLFVRNDGKEPVKATWANTSHPMPDDFTIIDETGAKVAVRIGHDDWRLPWISGYVGGGELRPGDVHTLLVPYEILIGGDGTKNKLIGRVIDAKPGQKLQLKVREHNGSERDKAEATPESGAISFALDVAKKVETLEADSGIQAPLPLLEFRFAAQLPSSQFEPRVPADFEKRDYSGNSAIGRMVARYKGFVWVNAVDAKNRKVSSLPVERLRGGVVREALLADTPEHALQFNGKWSIEECRVVPDPNGGDRFMIELKLNEAGGAAMRTLTKSHLNQPLAIVVNNEIVAVPIVRSEIGRNIAITGNFTREEVDKLADCLKPPVHTNGKEQGAPLQQPSSQNEFESENRDNGARVDPQRSLATPVALRGRVWGSHKRPLRGATVVLRVVSGDHWERVQQTLAKTVSDAAGSFELSASRAHLKQDDFRAKVDIWAWAASVAKMDSV